MKQTSKSYHIQGLVENEPRVVPFDKNGNYKFVAKQHATSFLTKLRKSFPNSQFRLVTSNEEYFYGEWNVTTKEHAQKFLQELGTHDKDGNLTENYK